MNSGATPHTYALRALVLVLFFLPTVLSSQIVINPSNCVPLDGSITDPLCNGDTTGSISISVLDVADGLLPPFIFAWADGLTDTINEFDYSRTGLVAGTYAVTVTAPSQEGTCTTEGDITLSDPPALTDEPDQNDPLCADVPNGLVRPNISGGTPPYTYAWSNGATESSLSDVAAGNYTLTVTDANGCQFVGSYTLTAPPALTGNATITAVTCNGADDGSITVAVQGGTPPYTIFWNDMGSGGGPPSRTGLSPGIYSASINDNSGCNFDLGSLEVTEPAVLSAEATTTDIDCFGEATGSIAVQVSGGTPPYNFVWNDGNTAGSRNNLAAGDYAVTITDAADCTTNLSELQLTQAAALSVTVTSQDIECAGDSDGNIAVTVNGGTPPYTHSWNDGGTGSTRNDLAPGTYIDTVQDAQQCILITEAITITELNSLTLDCRPESAATYRGAANGRAQVALAGGTPPFALNLSGPSANTFNTDDFPDFLTNLQAGDYNLTVTDASGCSVSCSFTIEEADQTCIVITDADLLNASYHWRKDTCYILDGLVYLEAGGNLEIDPGVVVKGLTRPSTGDNASALIITRGAAIEANGTEAEPILFTAERSPEPVAFILSVNTPPSLTDIPTFERGLWGGLFVFGNARIAHTAPDQEFAGLLQNEARSAYGGTNDADNSGSLSHLSVRHAGSALSGGERANGLTLGGVGSSTNVTHVEVISSGGDGIEVLGGMVDIRNASVAFCQENYFDLSLGYRGRGQYWFGLMGEDVGGAGIDISGGNSANGTPLSSPVIYNATMIGAGCDATGSDAATMADNTLAVAFDENAGGAIHNSIFLDFNKAIRVEDLASGLDSRAKVESGSLVISHNFWDGFCAGTQLNAGNNGIIRTESNFADPSAQYLIDHFDANQDSLLSPQLVSVTRFANGDLDPRPEAGFAFHTPATYPLGGDFFEPQAFKGAFGCSTSPWVQGWTALDQAGILRDNFGDVNGDMLCFEIPHPDTFLVSFNDSLPQATVNALLETYLDLGVEILQECHCKDSISRIYNWGVTKPMEINSDNETTKGKMDIDTSNANIPINIIPGVLGQESQVYCLGAPNINESSKPYRVKVAIIDSGLDIPSDLNKDGGHPALVGTPWHNAAEPVDDADNNRNCLTDDRIGYDFIDQTQHVRDPVGHGTHIAGIIASEYPANIDLELMNIKVYDQGKGDAFDLLCALNYALDNDAQVINLSLGYEDTIPPKLIYETLKKAEARNIPVIISAGNDSTDLNLGIKREMRWPPLFNRFATNDGRFKPLTNLIVVSALDDTEQNIDFEYSNYGNQVVDFAAKGIFNSTFKDQGYQTLAGTSMSAGYVSKFASIAVAYYQGGISPDSIRQIILQTADSIDVPSRDKMKNDAIFNFRAAYEFLLTARKIDFQDILQAKGVRPTFAVNEPAVFPDNVIVRLEDGTKVFQDVKFVVQRRTATGLVTIFEHTCAAASTIIWNCVLDDGTTLPDGEYFIHLEVAGQRVTPQPPNFFKGG